MKKKKIVIEVPKSLTTDFAGVTWFQDRDAMFFQNNKEGKRIPKEEGYIIQNRVSSLMHGDIRDGQLRVTYKFTVKQLELLLKLAKQRQKQFKECFFIHPFQDLSIMFVAEKRKKVSKK